MILQSTLSSLLPSSDEAALLRACLHDGDSAVEGWRRWRSGRPGAASDVCGELAEQRTLMPLLAESAARNELDVGQDVMAYLLAVTLREELRAQRYRAIAAETLRLLKKADVVPLVVGGSALSFTVYRVPAHRHCHDLDLLVRPREREQTVHALTHTDFSRTSTFSFNRHGVILEHKTGMPIAIHTRPFAGQNADAANEVICDSRSVALDNLHMSIPSPELMLVHALGHAPFGVRRRKHRWIVDSWHVVRRHDDLDWDKVLRWISALRLDIPAAALLAHLAALGLKVPAHVTSTATRLAETADRTSQDFAIGYVATAMHRNVVKMWRSTDSWRARLRLLRWFLLPSREYLRSTVRSHAEWMTPVFYFYRPMRSVASRLARLTR